jgi:hypothetical protein
MSEDIQAHWRDSFDSLRAALRNQPSRFTAWRLFVCPAHGSLNVRFDHIASIVVNTNHGIM